MSGSSAILQFYECSLKQLQLATISAANNTTDTTTMIATSTAAAAVTAEPPSEEQELLELIEKGYSRSHASPLSIVTSTDNTGKKIFSSSDTTSTSNVRIDPWDMLKHIDHYNMQEFNAWDLAREINWNYRELLYGSGSSAAGGAVLTAADGSNVTAAAAPGSKNVYLDACAYLGVIPNASFVRALEHAVRERSSAMVTPSTSAAAAPSKSKKSTVALDTDDLSAITNTSTAAAAVVEINLSCSGLSEIACRAVCIALVNNTNFTSLKLADNAIGPAGADYVQQLLRTNFTIVHLDISNNMLGHEGCRYVCYYLLTKKCHMQTLRTARNEWTDREIPLVAAALERNRSLTHWDLSHNNFSEKCGQMFGAALGENDTLVELNLSWNRIRGRGFQAFFTGFKNNVRLQVLHVQHNDLGDRGALQLAEAMKSKCNLIYLDLSSCNIYLAGCERLAKVLGACEELRTLKLAHNYLTHDGAYALLLVCSESTHIELLDLSGITVQPRFLKYLKTGIPTVTSNKTSNRPPKELPPAKQRNSVAKLRVLYGLPVMALAGPLPPQPRIKSAGATGANQKKKKKR